jgi:hypothetical protein
MGCRSNLLPLSAIWQQDFAQRNPLVLRLPRFRRIDGRCESPDNGNIDAARSTGAR